MLYKYIFCNQYIKVDKKKIFSLKGKKYVVYKKKSVLLQTEKQERCSSG